MNRGYAHINILIKKYIINILLYESHIPVTRGGAMGPVDPGAPGALWPTTSGASDIEAVGVILICEFSIINTIIMMQIKNIYVSVFPIYIYII